jgi:Protein of unknown function (DUF3800)
MRWRLYIDESGDHTFRSQVSAQWDKRYLCLLGCCFEWNYYRDEFCVALEKLKTEHFGSDPDDPVILHREDMIAKRGPFSILRDVAKNDAFRQAFLALIDSSKFRIFAVVVDKRGTLGKTFGPLPSHPYHIGVWAMMERYCGWLNFTKSSGDVLAECRGTREDEQLKAAYEAVYKGGTRFRASDFFQSALTTKEIKLKKKQHNVAGLQMSDLLAYPVKRRMLAESKRGPALTGFTKTLAESVERKYNRHIYHGRVSGYGKIWLV